MSANVLVSTPAYNKAPAPAKTPNHKLFPITKVVEKDQIVWVSVPIPDKLYLTVRLQPEHFSPWYKPDDPHEYGRMIMHALASGQAGAKLKNKYVEAAQLSTEVQIDLANIGEPVFFKLMRTKGDPAGPHTLSIQMNPAKLGEEGCYELLDRLHYATGQRLWVGRMLADARISRLDAAVDIVGVHICDILMSAKGAGKQAIWGSISAAMETLSIFRTKKKKNGASERGELIATAYDKRAERLQAGAVPPHEPAPVTRIELSKRRFGNKPFMLSALPSTPNPFKVVRVGLMRSAAPAASEGFEVYATLRRTVDMQKSSGLMSLSASASKSFENALLSHPADLIEGVAVWENWEVALQHTGVTLLVEAAEKGSSGVPAPDLDGIAA